MEENSTTKVFETRLIESFENAGWEVKLTDKSSEAYQLADLELWVCEHRIGYVECIHGKNSQELLRRMKKAGDFIKSSKPPVFIMTDGTQYHVSNNGGSFQTIHFIPSPQNYYGLVAVIQDWIDRIGVENDKEGNENE